VSYLAAYLISLTISVAVAAMCWDRRAQADGAGAYAVVAFSQASWTLGYVLEVSSASLEGKLFWDNFQYIGVAGWAVAFGWFVLDYTGHRRGHRAIALIAIPFIALVILAFTDQWHQLVRSNIRLVPTVDGTALLYDLGPANWAAAVLAYALFLVWLGLLAARWLRGATVYRRQIGLVLIGNAIPLVGTLLSLTALRSDPTRDLTPFTFAIGNALVFRALRRWRLFDLVPVAKDAVFENMSDAVYVVDDGGRLVELNVAALRLTATMERDRVVGRSVTEVFAAWPAMITELARAKREPLVAEVNGPGGPPQCFELRIVALGNRTQQRGHVVIGRDISERRASERELERYQHRLEELVLERTAALEHEHAQRVRLEARVHQAQKMEALGRLAGGVAHDFNNLLTIILTSADLLVRSRDPRTPAAPDLENILEAARQSAALTKQLLAFSRKEVTQPVALDVNEVVRTSEALLRRLLPQNIELVLDLDPLIGRVMADASRVQQVVMNLTINARDALPRGGRICISTSEVAREEIHADTLPASDATRFVRLRVRDTGVGMDRATRERAVEPFFTTKEPGKGTGLGLSTVHGIIEQSGGSMDIESEPGHGTAVTVYLPRIDIPSRSHAGAGVKVSA
jgi:PAS domain S-box-containing protein